jgi:sulfate adenylyltransferase subunit 1
MAEIIVAVNKMDLIGFDEATFRAIRREVLDFAERLGTARMSFVPMSALLGDMVVERGDNLHWWTGPTLLEALEAVDVSHSLHDLPLRFPVQLVTRPDIAGLHGARGYLGRVESGVVRTGQEIVVLPAGRSTVVREIVSLDGLVDEAVAGDCVTLVLADDLDISRGDLIAEEAQRPATGQQINARLCWLNSEPFEPQRSYLLRHTTRTVKARIRSIGARVNIHTLERDTFTEPLAMNDIVYARLAIQQPIASDSYQLNRSTGAFILIDEVSNQTVAAGLID